MMRVYMYGVHSDLRPKVLLAIFPSYERAYAYIEKHEIPREDGDGRVLGTRLGGVLDGFAQYDLAEVLIDPD